MFKRMDSKTVYKLCRHFNVWNILSTTRGLINGLSGELRCDLDNELRHELDSEMDTLGTDIG